MKRRNNMFKLNDRWVVTKRGASSDGWKWLKENDVLTVTEIKGMICKLEREDGAFAKVDYEIDVEEDKLLVPQNGTIQINPTMFIYLQDLAQLCHKNSYQAGWWNDPDTGEDLRDNIYVQATKIALIGSEVSEMLEGLRKNIMDDKLPEYPMELVEAADIIIRTLEYCAMKGYNIGEVVEKKLSVNKNRSDHKVENRKGKEGKKF